MSTELTDKFHALSADDRRRVEIVAANMLLSASLDCPNGREARVLKRAFQVVEEIGQMRQGGEEVAK